MSYIEDKDLDSLPNKNIGRRGFLGSMIGLFTAVNLPWIAADPKSKAIELPKNCLPEWKNYIRLIDGMVIQGSGVKDIDEKGNLILHDIMATEQLNVLGSILEYKGIRLSDQPFNGGYQCMCNGDILKITHNMNLTLFDNKTILKPDHPDFDYWVQKKFAIEKEIKDKYENNLHRY